MVKFIMFSKNLDNGIALCYNNYIDVETLIARLLLNKITYDRKDYICTLKIKHRLTPLLMLKK